MNWNGNPPVMPPFKTTVSLNITAAATGSVAVTFPAGRFSANPVVTATVNGGSGTTVFYGPAVSGLSSAGCTLNMFHRDGSTGTAALVIGVNADDPS